MTDEPEESIARSLDSIAYQLKSLGNGDAADPRGAIEYLATVIGEGLRNLAEASRSDYPLQGETFEGITTALSVIASAVEGHALSIEDHGKAVQNGMESIARAILIGLTGKDTYTNHGT